MEQAIIIPEGETLFNENQFRKDFETLAPYLTRLSIARKEPNLFISVILLPEAVSAVENFVLSLPKSLRPRKKKD